MTTRTSAPCPHKDCLATIPVSKSLPEGRYSCLCKAAELNLRWTTYANGKREASLELIPKEEA